MPQIKNNKNESVESNGTTDGNDKNSNDMASETHLPDETSSNNHENNNTSEPNLPGDDGEATDNNDTNASEQPPLENQSGEPVPDQDIKAAWTEAWDDQSQAYYWWNTITYETAWENPNGTATEAAAAPEASSYLQQQQQQQQPERTELDSVLDTIDTKVRAKLDGQSGTTQDYQPSPSSAPAYPYSASSATDHHLGATDPYRFQAFFNTKTGRFQNSNELAQRHPDQYTMEARAKRQMEHYFDVDAYQDQRNQQLEEGRKRSLSRKEVERFKRAKKEKKANRMREWLRD